LPGVQVLAAEIEETVEEVSSSEGDEYHTPEEEPEKDSGYVNM